MNDDRAAIDDVLRRFVDALNDLDLDRFLSLWGPDPSAILPAPQLARRVTGADEVRAGFAALLESMRATSTTDRPPYLALEPLDVDVQAIGEDVAVVTFHLELPAAFGRRTVIVARDERGGWSVRHLHASNVVTS